MTVGARSGGGVHPLLTCWLVASAFYVLVVGALSVEPIRLAIMQAQHPRASPLQRYERSTGPLPDAPDRPGVAIAKAVARQGALIVGPPLLVLWFGWDVWFAVVGFLKPRSGPP